MVNLQPKLSLRVSQKQILTPGLVQMVSVLVLNKIELKDMITAEMVENPVLEELDSAVPLLDEVAGREEDRERATSTEETSQEEKARDPFDEIDFGSYFRDYLDPGYRSPSAEVVERPSFENFLSRPTTLTDHLSWQLGSMHVSDAVREAAELIIGNLNEDGYLKASDEELLAASLGVFPAAEEDAEEIEGEIEEAASGPEEADALPSAAAGQKVVEELVEIAIENEEAVEVGLTAEERPADEPAPAILPSHPDNVIAMPVPSGAAPAFTRADLEEALALVRKMDPVGVGARDLRECLLAQLEYHQHLQQSAVNGDATLGQTLADGVAIVRDHLKALEAKQIREISRALDRPQEAVLEAVNYIRTLDPRPGLRYNTVEPRLIEPEVAFVKQGDDYLILMNDDDVPQLRLNHSYKRLLVRDAAEKDVRNYVKERYKSAIQLIKNIEQRRQTILRVCQAVLARQRDFLDHGIEQLKPMMIKEVAEEIGVHPSTVSRAVANKYAHTPQGVFELRYFFSEGVQGPEGAGTSLLVLKQRVKKLIEEEDPARPLTDERITRILQSQGIQVTRRTVAKYREDMRIPSTHQRRVKT